MKQSLNALRDGVLSTIAEERYAITLKPLGARRQV